MMTRHGLRASYGTSKQVTDPHPALRATLSRWERDGVARAFSLWEKVPGGRMRGGAYLSLVMFMTREEVP